MITQPRFGADQRDYESIRSPFASLRAASTLRSVEAARRLPFAQ